MEEEGDNKVYIWGYLKTTMERRHLRAYLGYGIVKGDLGSYIYNLFIGLVKYF
jgi:hypothetical protein